MNCNRQYQISFNGAMVTFTTVAWSYAKLY